MGCQESEAISFGGLVAAPIAAWVVRILPMRVLGTAVGGFILITNMKTFLEAVGVGGILTYVVYVAIFALWMAALTYSIFINRLEKRAAMEGQPA